VILTPGDTITDSDVAAHLTWNPGATPAQPEASPAPAVVAEDDEDMEGAAEDGTLRAQLDAAERVAIEEALKRAGTVARAAELLGLERSHLYKKLRKHRLPY